MSDPARKYIPKPKGQTSSDETSAELEHGTFTTIAYGTAWTIAFLGTVIGAIMIIMSFEARGYGGSSMANMGALLMGIVTIASSWIGAAGLGTLAEISRKLTKE